MPEQLELTLLRIKQDKTGTLGVLLLPNFRPVYTVEQPWRDSTEHDYGVSGASCVPPGEYLLTSSMSPSHKKMRWYLSTENGMISPHGSRESVRAGIMFHPANLPSQLRGCIAPGMLAHPGALGVLQSQMAQIEMDRALAGRTQALLSIRDAY